MSRKKILLVDDDVVLVKGMTHKLQARGYEVSSALDGSSAIKCVREDDPDLLILDIHFPIDVDTHSTWDAFTILQWLQRLNQDWQKPVIIITGGETAAYEDKAREAGAVAFFQKPVDYEAMTAVIRRELGQDKAPPGKPA